MTDVMALKVHDQISRLASLTIFSESAVAIVLAVRASCAASARWM